MIGRWRQSDFDSIGGRRAPGQSLLEIRRSMVMILRMRESGGITVGRRG